MLLSLTNIIMNAQEEIERLIYSEEPTASPTTSKTVASEESKTKKGRIPFTAEAFPSSAYLFRALRHYSENGEFRQISETNMCISYPLIKELIKQSIIKTYERDDSIGTYSDVHDLSVFLKKVYTESSILDIGACCRWWNNDVRLSPILIFELGDEVNFFTAPDFEFFNSQSEEM